MLMTTEDRRKQLISVLVPAYNEADAIEFTLREVAEAVAGQDAEVVVVVDEQSVDGTLQVATALDLQVAKTVASSPPGLVNAIMTGVEESSGELIVLMESDSSYPASDIPLLFGPLLADKADLVIGSRLRRDSHTQIASVPSSQRFQSWILSSLCRLLFGLEITDPSSNFLALRKSLFAKEAISEGPAPYLQLIANGLREGARICEVPTGFRLRFRSWSRYASFSRVLALFFRAVAILVGTKVEMLKTSMGLSR